MRHASVGFILSILSCWALFLFYGEVTSLASHYNPFENNNKTSSLTQQRSKYGYRRPQPPYAPVKHIPHTCVIQRNTSSEQVIHLPTAVPHLILIGAQKSGTSEFQVLADNHINVITPLSTRKFEPHFFDFQVQRSLLKILNKHNGSETEEFHDQVCRLREKYSGYFDMSEVGRNEVVMEKTPAYIMYGNISWMIDVVCPWKPKILAILRDPVDRAWSGYRMHLGRTNLSSFATMVKSEIDDFITYGLLDNATMSLDDFEANLKIDVPSSPFAFPQNMTLAYYAQLISTLPKNQTRGYIIRGMYAPLLLPWVEQFARDDRLIVMKFKDVFKEREVDEVLRFAGVMNTTIDEKYADVIRNHRGRIVGKVEKNGTKSNHAKQGREMQLDPTIELYLKFFFQPFNRFLPQLLGDEWEGWGEYLV